jgi:Cu2+-exporting ATPase
MNIMLFALPVYFGMDKSFPYARLFGLLSAAFATLSVLVGGGYFFSRAFRALRERVMHIDLPIAVGIIGAYGGSLYGWLAGRESFVYFDFVGTFILLMLVGRWAQVAAVERNRRRLLTAQARPDKVRIVAADGTVADRAVENLRPGESFLIRPGQVVPVEAQLESAAATFGTAWINGEADPRECRAGARLPAGAVNLSRTEVRLRAAQAWSDSLLAQLLQPAKRGVFRHRFIERIVSGYLIGVFVVATATGLAWWFGSHDAVRTWSIVTAVLVVSCPCAIGLAFPLADELATVALRRAGVFVREGDLWPRLGRIRKIIFDKTGTLTLETPVLQNPAALAALTPGARAALLALVRDNPHPISQSLYENLLGVGLPITEELAGGITEEPGFGVALHAGNGLWSLGRPGWRGGSVPAFLTDDHDTEFAHDGEVLARFRFKDTARLGARDEIAALRGLGFEVFILSGDRRAKVAEMAAALGLPPQNALGECTAQEKADWLRTHDRRDTLMLGDGANDSLAFNAAFARGTPVIHRGVLESKADFYYLGRGLGGLRELFSVNAARRRTQTWLLVFSVVYNALAVGLAVAGLMSPLLAAMLMPASSLLSLAIVAAGMRPVAARPAAA